MAPEVRRAVPRAVAKSVNADAPSGVTKLMVSNLHYELTTKDLAVRPSSLHVSSRCLMSRAANLWASWHTRPRAFDQGTKLAMHRVHLRETDPDLLSLVRLLSTTEAADLPASPSSATRPPRRLPQRRGNLMGSSPRVWTDSFVLACCWIAGMVHTTYDAALQASQCQSHSTSLQPQRRGRLDGAHPPRLCNGSRRHLCLSV